MPGFETGESKGKILLLDDEYTILETSKMMLELLGFSVMGSTSPVKALETLRDEGPFNLVITDLEMPEMNGREFSQKVRETSPGVPVVVVSGYVLDDDEWMPDFDGMLMKPFRVDDLKAKVEEFVSKG